MSIGIGKHSASTMNSGQCDLAAKSADGSVHLPNKASTPRETNPALPPKHAQRSTTVKPFFQIRERVGLLGKLAKLWEGGQRGEVQRLLGDLAKRDHAAFWGLISALQVQAQPAMLPTMAPVGYLATAETAIALVEVAHGIDGPIGHATTPPTANETSAASSTNTVDLQEWGLGSTQTKQVSHNRPYDWYVDQHGTGHFAGVNCGPAVATMAAKWVDGTVNLTVENTRNLSSTYLRSGMWSVANIEETLDKTVGSHHQRLDEMPTSPQDIQKILDDPAEKILIAGLRAGLIRASTDPKHHVDRFHDETGGHFIIIKGYREVDDQLFFEVYDPYSWTETYPDGAYKGQDRYYRSEEVIAALDTPPIVVQAQK